MKACNHSTAAECNFGELSDVELQQLDMVFEIAAHRAIQELAANPRFDFALSQIEDLREKLMYILDGRSLQ